MFVCFAKYHKGAQLSQDRLANWVKEVIVQTYLNAWHASHTFSIKYYSVHSMTPIWVALIGVSLADISEAVTELTIYLCQILLTESSIISDHVLCVDFECIRQHDSSIRMLRDSYPIKSCISTSYECCLLLYDGRKARGQALI